MLLAAGLTVLAVWLAGVVGADGVAEGGGRTTDRTTAPVVHHGRPSPAVQVLALLQGWDRRRAAAWASGEPAALGRLYVAGSRTGARDRHDLRRWAARGLRVTGLRQQIRSLRILVRTSRRVVVVVTDRTVGGVAVGAARSTAVPASGWETHRIILRAHGDQWRVAEARADAQPAR
jgi:hypothetical protein